MPARSRMRRGALVTLAVLSPVVPVATCGGGDDGISVSTTVATTTTSPEEAMCADRDALVTSIQDLADLDIVASGTDGVRQALSDVQDSLGELRESASDNFAPEVDALGDALQSLQDALGDAGEVGLSGIVDAARDVISSGGDLVDRLQSVDCD